MEVIYAPEKLPHELAWPSLFLGGSIEQGEAEEWQAHVIGELVDIEGVILNPRRREWDASWPQRADFAPFREQVEWELDALQAASHALLYFHPETKAPISLLELGLNAGKDGLVVVCPEAYWRRGNVEIVCERYRLPLYEGLEPAVSAIRAELG